MTVVERCQRARLCRGGFWPRTTPRFSCSRGLTMTWCCVLSWAIAGWSAADELVPGLELAYSGQLMQVDEKTPAKTFSYHAFVLAADDQRTDLAWLLEERGAGGWQWPERFGEF